MTFRRHITLFATILAFAAAIASGGSIARVFHATVAHGGGACAAHAAYADHADHADHAVHAEHASCTEDHKSFNTCEDVTGQPAHTHPAQPALAEPENDCPVCAELATQTLAPELASPFDLTVEVFAIVHEREAACQPKICAPRVFAARPPPTLL